MSEQTFRSPGFFEQEIDLSAREASPVGVPAGIAGTALKGPAFVPITVGSFIDFDNKFGTLHPEMYGTYAAREHLKNRTALTYVRVLGAGANELEGDMLRTLSEGTVKNAGFVIKGNEDGEGCVKFITAQHERQPEELYGFPVFSDNKSFSDGLGASLSNDSDKENIVRGMILLADGCDIKLMELDGNDYTADATDVVDSGNDSSLKKRFKIAIRNGDPSAQWGNDESTPGVRSVVASLDPTDPYYLTKVLNTDPFAFNATKHLLYADFPVEDELATVNGSIAFVSGSTEGLNSFGMPYYDVFGRFDTRYTTPRTTSFISQPYGRKEYDLFHFETISDGAYGNDKFKISIANIRASTDPSNPYGTFEVQVRNYDDVDSAPQILEAYPNCSLNPRSDRYVAKVIGDKKVYYDFDQVDLNERRLIVEGKYAARSQRIRIRMHPSVENGDIPKDCLPFGFRGLPVIKTSDVLTIENTKPLVAADGRILGDENNARLSDGSSAIVPPIPMRFKVTRGAIKANNPQFIGEPGANERADARMYWGVMTKRIPTKAAATNPILESNAGSLESGLVKSYTKFLGIQKLESLVAGTAADEFNSNKFTLARVAFSETFPVGGLKDVAASMNKSAAEHMLTAAYIRNADPNTETYAVTDRLIENRMTLATLFHANAVLFNRFSNYAKFTNVFYGGFDGVNVLDRDQALFKDRAMSSEINGKATQDQPDIGLAPINDENQSGWGRRNNAIASYNRAIDILTDPMSSNINVLITPGVREPFVTDYAMNQVRDYSRAFYVLDLIKYDEKNDRIYDDSKKKPDVRRTVEQFESRVVDNNYVATYFPDVKIDDPINNRVVSVPASVAAMGALSYNDRVSFPWYAPAGFNRGGLEFVRNVETRLNSNDRDVLYDARINPIAVFPNSGFVIFGQKTLQQAKSALDRVNVRRLMLEIKRQVSSVANGLLFEPNNAQTRTRFVNSVTPLLGLIQLQAGIEQFRVIMDDTNNSIEDVEANRLNGRIVVVPTRAVEFISVDFIITNSGVNFL
jgi:hypothetical protein